MTPRWPDRTGLWRAFWYEPESPLNLAAARVLLAAMALWMVLSRWDLPSVLAFPQELWVSVPPERRLRFFMVLGLGLERVLYGLLHVALLLALVGLLPRVSCFVSGLLLYHFAPFETIIRTPNPYLRGLTIPTLGLLVLSFSPCGERLRLLGGRAAEAAEPSWQYGWGLRLIQVLFCQIYFFAGYSKLFTSGLAWLTADNIRGYLWTLNQGLTLDPEASLGYALARHRALCSLVAWSGVAFELAFPLVLFSRASRRLLVPLALLFHVANVLLFRIFFQNAALLLLFVDWASCLKRRGASS